MAGCHCIRPRRSFRCRSRLPCDRLGQSGALVVLVAVQLSVLGLYLPPVFKSADAIDIRPRRSFHCRSTLPCDRIGQRARWWCWWLSNYPCRDCISRRCSIDCSHHIRPRRSFQCQSTLRCDALRASGALTMLVAVQLSVLGLYLSPVFNSRAVVCLPKRSFHCQSTLPCDRFGDRDGQRRWLSSYHRYIRPRHPILPEADSYHSTRSLC